MIFNHQYIKEEYPKTIVSINNGPVENTAIFKYLGCNLKHDKPSTGNSELEIRINTGECKFYEVWKNNELQNHALYMRENHEYSRV